MKKKAYISGQITGLPQAEYSDNFGKAEASLIDAGFDPVNPLKVPACVGEGCNQDFRKEDGTYLHAWQCYMQYDLIAMLECEYVFMLPDYRNSQGALFELEVAERVGLSILYFEDAAASTFKSWSAR